MEGEINHWFLFCFLNRAHPHSLIGEHCKDRGFYKRDMEIDENVPIEFSDLGIQCVKKANIQSKLLQRQEFKIDPFNSKCDRIILVI